MLRGPAPRSSSRSAKPLRRRARHVARRSRARARSDRRRRFHGLAGAVPGRAVPDRRAAQGADRAVHRHLSRRQPLRSLFRGVRRRARRCRARARKAELRAVVQRYAARLEHYVRQDPYNWFNWHDFWNLEGFDDGTEPSARDAISPSPSRAAPELIRGADAQALVAGLKRDAAGAHGVQRSALFEPARTSADPARRARIRRTRQALAQRRNRRTTST